MTPTTPASDARADDALRAVLQENALLRARLAVLQNSVNWLDAQASNARRFTRPELMSWIQSVKQTSVMVG
jgi:hypothetical protein